MNDRPPLPEGELITGIIRILSEADRWIVVTHCKPDGDTLGSGSAFLALGESMGKKVAWGGPDPFPEIYGFLYGADRYVPDIAPDFPALKKGTRSSFLTHPRESAPFMELIPCLKRYP